MYIDMIQVSEKVYVQAEMVAVLEEIINPATQNPVVEITLSTTTRNKVRLDPGVTLWDAKCWLEGNGSYDGWKEGNARKNPDRSDR